MAIPLTTNTVLDVAQLPLEPLMLAADDVVDGAPAASAVDLLDTSHLAVGVWELTEGVVTDTEVDEVFVVVSGHATLEFEGDDRVLQLGPGTIGRLAAGSRTRWTVTETLRKVYVIAPNGEVAL